jgi:hypothetical protein
LIRQIADLSFPDHVHGLVSRDGVSGTIEGSQALAGGNPFLDETMVLLDDVIQIR